MDDAIDDIKKNKGEKIKIKSNARYAS